MSIIESAFLKTLKNSKDEINKERRNTDNSLSDPKKTANQESIDNIEHEIEVSSRKDISLMSQNKKYSQKELDNYGLLSNNCSDSELLNEYRNLRTKLIAGQSKKNFTTLITSIVPGYDISLVVANIAIAFALDASKTSLVIDADVSSNRLNKLFDIELNLGIIDYLESDNMAVDKVLYETPISRLRYIPSGVMKDGSYEYFTTTRMTNFIQSVTERYSERFPIIMAPSIGDSADTPILIGSCDCVILVAPYGKCTESCIKEAMMTVGGEKFAGIILDEF